MAERQLIIDHQRITYEGLFLIKDILKTFNEWAGDKGYAPVEVKHTEGNKPDGRYIEADYRPFKKVTDYIKNIIHLRIICSEIKDVIIEQEGTKKKMQQGKVQLIITAWLETDYEHRWETKPIFYVLRTIFEKYIYTPFLTTYTQTLKDDTNLLQDHYKGYFNMYKYI